MKSTNKTPFKNTLSKKTFPKNTQIGKSIFSLAFLTPRPDSEAHQSGTLSSAENFFGSHMDFYIPLALGTILRWSDLMRKNIDPYGGCFLFFIEGYSTEGEEPTYNMIRSNGLIEDEHIHSAKFIHTLIIDNKLLHCTIDEAAKLVLLS
jgi:hypothetical protein